MSFIRGSSVITLSLSMFVLAGASSSINYTLDIDFDSINMMGVEEFILILGDTLEGELAQGLIGSTLVAGGRHRKHQLPPIYGGDILLINLQEINDPIKIRDALFNKIIFDTANRLKVFIVNPGDPELGSRRLGELLMKLAQIVGAENWRRLSRSIGVIIEKSSDISDEDLIASMRVVVSKISSLSHVLRYFYLNNYFDKKVDLMERIQTWCSSILERNAIAVYLSPKESNRTWRLDEVMENQASLIQFVLDGTETQFSESLEQSSSTILMAESSMSQIIHNKEIYNIGTTLDILTNQFLEIFLLNEYHYKMKEILLNTNRTKDLDTSISEFHVRQSSILRNLTEHEIVNASPFAYVIWKELKVGLELYDLVRRVFLMISTGKQLPPRSSITELLHNHMDMLEDNMKRYSNISLSSENSF